MAYRPGTLLRYTAASLMCLSGLGQIAALWLRQLTGSVLIDGLLGTVYLLTGIGLFGRSRFSLFMAVVIPMTASGVLLNTAGPPQQLHVLRIAVDVAVALLSMVVLWQLRHHPSE